MRLLGALFVSGLSLAACKGAERPRVPAAGSETIEVGQEGYSLRGVTSDGTRTFVALSGSKQSIITARRGNTVDWSANAQGSIEAMTVAGRALIVAEQANGDGVS
jgi:hypothetical protein